MSGKPTVLKEVLSVVGQSEIIQCKWLVSFIDVSLV